MAPYRKTHKNNNNNNNYELGAGDSAKIVQVRPLNNCQQVYTAISHHHPRTTSISVSPAAADEFIKPATAKRAKKSAWERVLPPYNVGPEEAKFQEIHDHRDEIQQEEMVPSRGVARDFFLPW